MGICFAWPVGLSLPVPLFRTDGNNNAQTMVLSRRCPPIVRLLNFMIVIREGYSLFIHFHHLMIVKLHGFQHGMFRYIVLFSFNYIAH